MFNTDALTPVITVVSFFIGLGQLAVMCYALYRFLNKPHTTLEGRVTTLEVKVNEQEKSLHAGNDKFRAQDELNELFIRCMLGFISFETNYCLHTGYEHDEDLRKTKELLETCLAKR